MRNSNDIKAILFDFMGVLLFEKADYNPDTLVDKIDGIIGSVTDDAAFKAQVLKEYNFTESEFAEILRRIIDKYEKFQPIWDLLPALRKTYKLAIINNGTTLTLEGLKSEHRTDKYFDLFVSSAIEGIGKPDSDIFLRTAQRLVVEPEECLFMDDTKENIIGAEKVGMQTIWWQNASSGFMLFRRFLQNNHYCD